MNNGFGRLRNLKCDASEAEATDYATWVVSESRRPTESTFDNLEHIMRNLVQSNSIPDIIQNCWIVPDLDLAMRHWIDVGYGPFLTIQLEVPNMVYRGRVEPLVV